MPEHQRMKIAIANDLLWDSPAAREDLPRPRPVVEVPSHARLNDDAPLYMGCESESF